jgi:hypothetical protein
MAFYDFTLEATWYPFQHIASIETLTKPPYISKGRRQTFYLYGTMVRFSKNMWWETVLPPSLESSVCHISSLQLSINLHTPPFCRHCSPSPNLGICPNRRFCLIYLFIFIVSPNIENRATWIAWIAFILKIKWAKVGCPKKPMT